MKTIEKAKGYGQIQILSPYELQILQQVEIVRYAGEHAKLYLSGIVPEALQATCVERAEGEDTVELRVLEASGSTRTVFKGLVSSIAVRAVQGIYYLELEGISFTSLMDLKRQSRSFQDHGMSYSDMIATVISSYAGSDVIDYVTYASTLGGFTLQYLETDWQFVKRMASRFGAVVMAEAVGDGPKFTIGLPDGRLHQMPDTPFVVNRNLADFMNIAMNEGRGSELDFTSYTIETDQIYNIGDKILFQEGELTVAGYTARLEDGVLKYTYILMLEESIRVRHILNETMVGATLQGRVEEVNGHAVKVLLDIDEGQEHAIAGWFPYASAYAAEGTGGASTICRRLEIGYRLGCLVTTKGNQWRSVQSTWNHQARTLL